MTEQRLVRACETMGDWGGTLVCVYGVEGDEPLLPLMDQIEDYGSETE